MTKATFGLMPDVALSRTPINLSSDHRQYRALGRAAIRRADGSIDPFIGGRRADVEGR
jgi:hypothetical protein